MRLATTRFPPGSELPPHARPVRYLSLVVTGSYTEHIGGAAIHCRALSLRFHPPGEEHSHRMGRAGSECLNIELDDGWSESVRRLDASRRPVHVASAGRAGSQLIEMMRGEVGSERAAAELLVADLLALCERQLGIERAAKDRPCIRRAIEMIDDDPRRPLSLAAIAAEAGVHPTHLARGFKQAMGVTVGAYIRTVRRQRAETLLIRQPALNISRVAAETGFADHAHMTRTFRKEIGLAPSEYRQRYAL